MAAFDEAGAGNRKPGIGNRKSEIGNRRGEDRAGLVLPGSQLPAPGLRFPIPGSRFPASQKGFTLIEAIAAFVLLALFIGVLMSALSTSMRQTVRAEQESLAAQWAQSKLDLVGIGEKLETGSTRDRFDDDYRWEMTVEEYIPPRVAEDGTEVEFDPQALGMSLYKVDLDVFWGRRGQERSTRFTTLRAYAPDQAILFNNPDAAGDPANAMGLPGMQPGMRPGMPRTPNRQAPGRPPRGNSGRKP